MPSYRPDYANSDHQPVNSRHNNKRAVRGSRRHRHDEPHQNVQQPSEQVDSWRSYRNDSTNLQSMRGTNPVAIAFQPSGQSTAPVQQQGLSLPSSNRNAARTAQPRQQANISTFMSGGARNSYQSTLQFASAARAVNSSVRSIHASSVPAPKKTAASRGSHAHHAAHPPPPVAPQATEAYKNQAQLLPYSLSSPQKLLVILDLNGTLVYRTSRTGKPASIRIRPGVTQLLDYLFTNHVVMIYTSARPENALGMVNQLLHPRQRNKLAGIWARDQLDLTQAQYAAKVQVYKKLDKVWNDQTIQATHPSRQNTDAWSEGSKDWDQTNTVLVDDSLIKGMSHPYNLLQVPEFVNDKPDAKQGMEAMNLWSKTQQDILKGLEARIETLKWTADVSRVIRMWQTGKKEVPISQGQNVVVQECLDQGRTIGGSADRDGSAISNPGLPTARSSLQDDVEEDDDDDDDDAGAPVMDKEVSELNQYFGQNSLEDSGGVSPVDETVFQELLGSREDVAKRSVSNATNLGGHT